MSIGNRSQDLALPSLEITVIPSTCTLVAVIVEWRGKVALLKRSRDIHHDRGLWHCISSHLEPGASPKQQAIEKLIEETGLHAAALLDLRAGPDLVIISEDTTPWLVHTFTAVTSERRLKIDSEHDAYRWVAPNKVKRFVNRVAWVDDVLQAALPRP